VFSFYGSRDVNAIVNKMNMWPGIWFLSEIDRQVPAGFVRRLSLSDISLKLY